MVFFVNHQLSFLFDFKIWYILFSFIQCMQILFHIYVFMFIIVYLNIFLQDTLYHLHSKAFRFDHFTDVNILSLIYFFIGNKCNMFLHFRWTVFHIFFIPWLEDCCEASCWETTNMACKILLFYYLVMHFCYFITVCVWYLWIFIKLQVTFKY